MAGSSKPVSCASVVGCIGPPSQYFRDNCGSLGRSVPLSLVGHLSEMTQIIESRRPRCLLSAGNGCRTLTLTFWRLRFWLGADLRLSILKHGDESARHGPAIARQTFLIAPL